MDAHLNSLWQTRLLSFTWLLAAILTSQIAYYFLYTLFRRLSLRRSVAAQEIINHTQQVSRLLFLLLAVSMVWQRLDIPDWLVEPGEHGLEIGYIIVAAWLAIAVIEVFNALVSHNLPQDLADNVRARRRHTRTHLLRQIAVGLIAFTALAAVLMTFPSIRDIGAGLFASAGLAGLVLGMAARPTLGNLIAGVQIALTEPIRIEDAVVVEGELGRVVEVNTTYVIVRLWDLRHMVVPLSYFIEKPFQNWTRYSSDLIGVVLLYTDYTVPVDKLREEYRRILESSSLWDRKTMAVQVTNATERSLELRFLMSAGNPTATFDLRCYVRERLIRYLQEQYPQALPRLRSEVSMVDANSKSTAAIEQGL
jgi:small-conductance mechanosensitive channel